MGHAWLAWLVMGGAWVADRRLHRFWPISGTVAGCLSILLTFGFGLVFTLPAILMAGVVIGFHLDRPKVRP